MFEADDDLAGMPVELTENGVFSLSPEVEKKGVFAQFRFIWLPFSI